MPIQNYNSLTFFIINLNSIFDFFLLAFLDCALRIVGSGRYTCSTTDADGNGPVCKISCNHYEDKPPVAEASYRCDNSGKWSPKLPHCVAPKGGINLF